MGKLYMSEELRERVRKLCVEEGIENLERFEELLSDIEDEAFRRGQHSITEASI
jgi:hypothetical protein